MVGKGNGLLAVWVGLEGFDGVGYDRVRGKVLISWVSLRATEVGDAGMELTEMN